MFQTKKVFKKMMGLGLLASLVLVALLSLVQTNAALAATAPNLGTTGTYGVVSSTFTNSNTGTQTLINGDVCFTTGPTTPPLTINGATGTPCPPATGLDQGLALADLLGQACTSLGDGEVALNSVVVGGNPPGTIPPGCYSSGGAMNITATTTVTLSGNGVYIFRPGGALTTGANSRVVLAGGACATDVFWAPVGATTLGANAAPSLVTPTFVGNILDAAGISIGHFANLTGRALAFGGTVLTDANTITVPTDCAPIPAKLGLNKTVSLGPALPSAFNLTATGDLSTGPTVITGPAPVAPADAPVGIYTLTESGPTGYTASAFSCIGGGSLVGNRLTIGAADAGNTIICTIDNALTPAIAARLGLRKTVSSGTALATDFILTATGDASTGPTVLTGTTPVGPSNVPVGIYTLTESGPTGYTASAFSCIGGGSLVGNKLTIGAADAGNTITCTIDNALTPAISAQLGLRKTVTSGTALATDFILTATGDASTGPTVITGTTPVVPSNVPVGVYTLTESGPTGYTASAFICIGGGSLVGNRLTIGAADAGKTITCTISNSLTPAIAAQLSLRKTVISGTALATDFILTATGDASTGPTVITGTTPVGPSNVPVGVYTLTETGPSGYTAGFSCDGGSLVGNQLTITTANAGQTITCTITNTLISAPVSIPTLNEWGVIIFMMLAGLGSVYYLRKYRRV